MPSKVQPVHDKAAQSLFDLIFPKQQRLQAGLSDAEAGLIYQMWKSAPTGAQEFAVPAGADAKVVIALKEKGYLFGMGNGVELTDKGKKVIVEMVTHEPNAFLKQAKEVSYSMVKSKTCSRPIQSLVKKQKLASRKEEVQPFNLRQYSLRRMSGEC